MRDFIAGVLLLAFIFVFFASIFAMVKPLPKLKMPTRGSGFKGLGVALLLLIATAIVMPAPKNGVATNSEKSTVASNGKEPSEKLVPSVPQEPALPVTLAEFSNTFDIIAGKMDKPWKANFKTKEDGSFSLSVTENLVMNGKTRSDGKIVNMLAVAAGDGTPTSGLDVFVFFASIYCAVHQFDDPKKCGAPMMDLIRDFDEGGKATSTTLNNIKFEYVRGDNIGNWLTVSVN